MVNLKPADWNVSYKYFRYGFAIRNGKRGGAGFDLSGLMVGRWPNGGGG